jgi:hypothetical protein
MQVAATHPRDHFCQVEPLGLGTRRPLGFLERGTTRGQRRLDLLTLLVESLPFGPPLVGRQLAETLLAQREVGLLAEQLGRERRELGQRCRRVDASGEVVFHRAF